MSTDNFPQPDEQGGGAPTGGSCLPRVQADTPDGHDDHIDLVRQHTSNRMPLRLRTMSSVGLSATKYDALLRRLRELLGPDGVITDPDLLAAHCRDQSALSLSGSAMALLRPGSTADIAAVVGLAREHAVPLVAQGALTGLSGGANAIDGCLLLSMSRLDAIIEIDVDNGLAVVQPGVTNAALSRAVAARGLFYPPDPSSWQSSTIGGNVATNAGGLCCVKYGVTADYLRELEVVIGTGEAIRVGRRTAKGVAGYNLAQLFVGSEGTLGVITEVTVGLRPAQSASRTAAALFGSAREALHAAERIMATGLRPSMLEFLDGTMLRAIQAYRDVGFPSDADGMLIIESDNGPLAGEEISRMAQICSESGAHEVAEAVDAQEGQLLQEARRLALPAAERLGTVLIDDIALPRSRMLDFLDSLDTIRSAWGVQVFVVGHVGDGNLHPIVCYQAESEEQCARGAFEAIMDLGLELGGTITGEHGVGLLKRDALKRELGDTVLGLHRQLKNVFDPVGIFNPGKVFTN